MAAGWVCRGFYRSACIIGTKLVFVGRVDEMLVCIFCYCWTDPHFFIANQIKLSCDLLPAALYVMARHQGGKNLLIDISARNLISVFPFIIR